jgi:hypothetical protein
VVRAALRVKPCMNGPPKGGPLTLEQCKALQARVASLEAALREIVDEGDGDPTAEWFVEVARSALSGAAQPRGEPAPAIAYTGQAGNLYAPQEGNLEQRALNVKVSDVTLTRTCASCGHTRGAHYPDKGGLKCGNCGCTEFRSLAPDAQPRGEGARCERCGGDGTDWNSSSRKPCPACSTGVRP